MAELGSQTMKAVKNSFKSSFMTTTEENSVEEEPEDENHGAPIKERKASKGDKSAQDGPAWMQDSPCSHILEFVTKFTVCCSVSYKVLLSVF